MSSILANSWLVCWPATNRKVSKTHCGKEMWLTPLWAELCIIVITLLTIFLFFHLSIDDPAPLTPPSLAHVHEISFDVCNATWTTRCLYSDGDLRNSPRSLPLIQALTICDLSVPSPSVVSPATLWTSCIWYPHQEQEQPLSLWCGKWCDPRFVLTVPDLSVFDLCVKFDSNKWLQHLAMQLNKWLLGMLNNKLVNGLSLSPKLPALKNGQVNLCSPTFPCQTFSRNLSARQKTHLIFTLVCQIKCC